MTTDPILIEERIAVALSRGAEWFSVKIGTGFHDQLPTKEVLSFGFPGSNLGPMRTDLPDGRILAHNIPDYHEDLDACYELEESLSTGECYSYHSHVLEYLNTWEPKKRAKTWPWHLPAPARVRCYLKTRHIFPGQ